ncbi:MAG: hypothetical protein A3H96_03780 [Acidobacteria bacterium RIFCSPLOWO2_02_FULL_67_36]|nr:MAG: hypothetical protein A3H96_03780 [Acidobacteria bacterium RIFCSPLOWO2_02_FULL_67_36]
MFARRVLPGAALVRATVRLTSALISVDLPTFDRPAIATCGRPSRGMPAADPPDPALVMKSTACTFIRRHPAGTRPAERPGPQGGLTAGRPCKP